MFVRPHSNRKSAVATIRLGRAPLANASFQTFIGSSFSFALGASVAPATFTFGALSSRPTPLPSNSTLQLLRRLYVRRRCRGDRGVHS